MRYLAILIAAAIFDFSASECLNGGYPVNSTFCNCPSFFDGYNCSIKQCINGGYLTNDICTCPPGYLGVHCEAVKTSQPSDNHFSTPTVFNFMNFNLYTRYWGIATYKNIRTALDIHFSKNNYSDYNLMQTIGSPTLTDSDETDFSKVNSTYNQQTMPFQLNDPVSTGLYWCYQVEIFRNITAMIKEFNLRNTAISIVTQHPPSLEEFETAREAVLAFGVKINVLWISDQTSLNCSNNDVESLKDFAEKSGGMFVQLKTDIENDSNTQTAISSVLMTHINSQVIIHETWSYCEETISIPIYTDPNIADNIYYFALFGENVTIDKSSRDCNFKGSAISFDKSAIFLWTPEPSCANISIKANGPCTSIVYTNHQNETTSVGIFKSYVKNNLTDASRYAIVENVQFMPVLHIETSAKYNVSLNSAILISDMNTMRLNVTRREMAAFEWIVDSVSCSSQLRESLRLNLTIDSFNIQRSVPINCIAASTIATTTTASTSAMSTAEATSTIIPSTEIPCINNLEQSVFFFGYPSDMNLNTYVASRQKILASMNQIEFTYKLLEDCKTDSTDNSIRKTTKFIDFSTDLTNYAPNSTASDILPSTMHSNVLDIIKKFVHQTDDVKLENGIALLFINRFPSVADNLEDEVYNKLADQNIKIFTIISHTSLLKNDVRTWQSGDVFNKIAALTNGHYIVANDTEIKESSDFDKIVGEIMQFGYGQDLLFTGNYGVENHNSAIGDVIIPDSSNGPINFVLTISLSSSNTTLPTKPAKLLVRFLKNGKPALDIDVLNSATSYSSSNFYKTDSTLNSGRYQIVMQYIPDDQKHDVLIRIWTDKLQQHSSKYVDLNGDTIIPDIINGAALRFTVNNGCSSFNNASIVIRDCNGIINQKYDVEQISTIKSATMNDDNSTTYYFTPYFCENSFLSQKTCVNGVENKYDVQFIAGEYSISRSFLCQPSNISFDPSCTETDAKGNYQCTGAAPFKRGPTKKITDCSGMGTLYYNKTSDSDSYSEKYQCECNDGAYGESCEQTNCISEDTTGLALDTSYRTYTLIIDVNGDSSPLPIVLSDAKSKFSLSGANLTNIWKFQLILRCQDGQVETLYNGGDVKGFQNAFDKSFLSCSIEGKKTQVDLVDIYKESIRGIGRNVKGIIVFFSEDPNNMTVSLDKFIEISQTYQQQLFVFVAEETDSITPIDRSVGEAAMSTGGFVQQSLVNSNINFDEKFIPNLLSNSVSIAYIGLNLTKSTIISFDLEKSDSFAYVITWHRGGEMNDGKNADCPNSTDDVTTFCEIRGKDQHQITSTSSSSPFEAVVYVINEVNPSARIISQLKSDTSDAVSTSTSDTRTMLGVHVPDGYTVSDYDIDDGRTRIAKRTGCTYQYTSYSVFEKSRLSNGFNAIKITLLNSNNEQLTRYFPFGTTTSPACKNEGTQVNVTGSCQCRDGFYGPDCSLVKCSEMEVSNAWADICICDAIDDVQCASRLT